MNQLTSEQKQDLMSAATEALNNSYPKGAETVYGAAVLTKQGHIYSAAQYFSETYSLTLHGEQSALAHAAAHGEGEIIAIAITSTEKSDELAYPCHMCKQLLWESSRRSKLPMTLIVFNKDKIEEIALEKMILYPWPAA